MMMTYLYFMQDNLVFAGAYAFKKSVQEEKNMVKEITELSFMTSDNIKLNGAISNKNSDTLVIFFAGNAQNAINLVSLMSKLDGFDTVALNYRGYDKSQGVPSEQNFYTDALEIYDHYKDKYKYIISAGNSLGSSVATYLASKREIKGVILTVPLDSILNVARSDYPIFPIKLLLKYPFNSVDRLKDIDVPISILMVKDDEIVPNDNTINLKNNVKNLSLFTLIENSGHSTIMDDERLLEFISQSIKKLD